jgi:hypothetical protein
MSRNQFHESRRGRLLLFANNRTSREAPLQPHVVQPQRMSNRMQTVLPRQFYRSLPQRFGNLRPVRLSTAKLIQLPLQLNDGLRDG